MILLAFTFLYIIFRGARNTNGGVKSANLGELNNDQTDLDTYLNSTLPPDEIGKLYERFVGYIYELYGYDVEYYGAIHGISDMGRDLIVRKNHKIFIVQTKCWAGYKTISESHIFQLYGSLVHFKKTNKSEDTLNIKAVFYTTAKYSSTAKAVAKVLDINLKTKKLNTAYPMIKCVVTDDRKKTYYLPVDSNYDQIKVQLNSHDFYAKTVQEALDNGFTRACKQTKAA